MLLCQTHCCPWAPARFLASDETQSQQLLPKDCWPQAWPQPQVSGLPPLHALVEASIQLRRDRRHVWRDQETSALPPTEMATHCRSASVSEGSTKCNFHARSMDFQNQNCHKSRHLHNMRVSESGQALASDCLHTFCKIKKEVD